MFLSCSGVSEVLTLCKVHIPLTIPNANTIYWSKHARDAVFGAKKGQPLSVQWRGLSSLLAPPDAAEQEKLVRWALFSTSEEKEATATLLLLPQKARCISGRIQHMGGCTSGEVQQACSSEWRATPPSHRPDHGPGPPAPHPTTFPMHASPASIE